MLLKILVKLLSYAKKGHREMKEQWLVLSTI
jgi:hypothetical protein